MWHKKFLYVLNYLKIFKAAVQKQSMDTLTATKKGCVVNNCLFHSLYSRTAAEIVTVFRYLCLPKTVFLV